MENFVSVVEEAVVFAGDGTVGIGDEVGRDGEVRGHHVGESGLAGGVDDGKVADDDPVGENKAGPGHSSEQEVAPYFEQLRVGCSTHHSAVGHKRQRRANGEEVTALIGEGAFGGVILAVGTDDIRPGG